MISAKEAKEMVFKHNEDTIRNTEKIINDKVPAFFEKAIKTAASSGRTNVAIMEIAFLIEEDTGITNYNKSNVFVAIRAIAQENGFSTNRDLIEWGGL